MAHECSSNPEKPIIVDHFDEEGGSRFRFTFEGEVYDVLGPSMGAEQFADWLTDYAGTTPRCACCERVIFPGQPVTLGHVNEGDSGHSHLGVCNDTAAGFAGSFTQDGVLASPEAA